VRLGGVEAETGGAGLGLGGGLGCGQHGCAADSPSQKR
jgi:hypothetical protein